MKRTNIDLPAELEALDAVKYAEIIEKAKANKYHDFKSTNAMPKIDLVQDLGRFPELHSIKQNVIGGMYDEPMDDEDKADMRKDLKENGGEGIAKALGLDLEE